MTEKKMGRPKGKPNKTNDYDSARMMMTSMVYCHKIGWRHGYIASKLGGDWPKKIKTEEDQKMVKDLEKEADILYREYEQFVDEGLSEL